MGPSSLQLCDVPLRSDFQFAAAGVAVGGGGIPAKDSYAAPRAPPFPAGPRPLLERFSLDAFHAANAPLALRLERIETFAGTMPRTDVRRAIRLLLMHREGAFPRRLSTLHSRPSGQSHLYSDAKIAHEWRPQGGGEGTHKGYPYTIQAASRGFVPIRCNCPAPPFGIYSRELQARRSAAMWDYVSSPARMKYCSIAVFEGERGWSSYMPSSGTLRK